MNERERAVCSRVKMSREDIKWPQSDFAQAIGIKKDKLASIEYGRTPLRYRTGVDLCEVFGLSGDWLITGAGPMHGGAPILWEIEFPFDTYGKKLFTEVYDLAPNVFCHTELVFGLIQEPTPGFDAEAYLSRNAARWFRKMKFRTAMDAESFARSVNDFAKRKLQELLHIGTTSQKRLSQLKAEHEAGVKLQPTQSKSMLDDAGVISHTVGVQNEIRDLKGLIERLKRVTAPRGAKAALAREFKVSRQAVNQWLSGESNPSADIAIRLQYWKPKLPEK
jgi:DNA-binding XRE family transcriptional regulator